MNEALSAFLDILNRMGLRHVVVGSIASSIHGLPRFTNDADLLVEIRLSNIAALAEFAGQSFWFDPDEAAKSIAAGRAFNLIHLASAGKIDVFPAGSNPFHTSELERSVVADWVVPGMAAIRLPVQSAEDTVLSKLLWYQSGGQVSDRQWNDILGIATRHNLDKEYMNNWARRLGVDELVVKLRAEIGD
jgi:hypothetical protein